MRGGISGRLLGPESDLLKGLGQCVNDDGGFSGAETLDGKVRHLVGVIGCVPEADDDAVMGQMYPNALTDRASLREG